MQPASNTLKSGIRVILRTSDCLETKTVPNVACVKESDLVKPVISGTLFRTISSPQCLNLTSFFFSMRYSGPVAEAALLTYLRWRRRHSLPNRRRRRRLVLRRRRGRGRRILHQGRRWRRIRLRYWRRLRFKWRIWRWRRVWRQRNRRRCKWRWHRIRRQRVWRWCKWRWQRFWRR